MFPSLIPESVSRVRASELIVKIQGEIERHDEWENPQQTSEMCYQTKIFIFFFCTYLHFKSLGQRINIYWENFWKLLGLKVLIWLFTTSSWFLKHQCCQIQQSVNGCLMTSKWFCLLLLLEICWIMNQTKLWRKILLLLQTFYEHLIPIQKRLFQLLVIKVENVDMSKFRIKWLNDQISKELSKLIVAKIID